MDEVKPPRNIYQRMNAVMLEVSSAKKTRENQHHRYKFIGHDDVTTAIRDACAKQGIVQRVTIVAIERSGDHKEDVTVTASIQWVNMDNPEDHIYVQSYGESFGHKGKPDDLQIAKAVSLAVKVAQLKNFMLTGDTTPDNEVSHGAPATVDNEAEEAAVAALTSLETVSHWDGLQEIAVSIQPIAGKVSRRTLDLLNAKYEAAEKRLSA